MTYKLLSSSSAPLAQFGEQELVLARGIAEHTGIIPSVDVVLSDDEEARPVLRFWLRDNDGAVVSRDIDLLKFDFRVSVKHALREAMRTVRLDHAGPPITDPPPAAPEGPSVAQAIVAAYEQALIDFGIDKAGDFNPEGWFERALKRATWREKC